MSGLLVGRTGEEGALRGFLRASRAGRAPVVLLAGEAGVGKTAGNPEERRSRRLAAHPRLTTRYAIATCSELTSTV
jgi:hypothetical protein